MATSASNAPLPSFVSAMTVTLTPQASRDAVRVGVGLGGIEDGGAVVADVADVVRCPDRPG